MSRTARMLMAASRRLALAAAMLLLAAAPAPAQDDGAVDARVSELLAAFPDGLTREQIDALVAAMDEGAIRAALAERLQAEVQAREAAQAAAPREALLDLYARRLDAVGSAYGRLPAALSDALNRPGGHSIPGGGWRLAGGIALLVLVGWAGLRGAVLVLRPWRARIAAGALMPRGGIAVRAILWLVLDAIEIAAFAITLAAAYLAIQPTHPAAPHILVEILKASVMILAAARIARLLFDPARAGIGLLPLEARVAAVAYRAVVTLVAIVAILAAASRGLRLLGLGDDELIAIVLPLSAAPFAYLLAVIWGHRAALAAAIADRLHLGIDGSAAARGIVGLATVYLAALWLITAESILRAVPGIGIKAMASLVIVVLLPLIAWVANAPLRRLYGANADDPVAEAHLRRLMRAVWVVLLLLAIAATAWLWGFDAASLGVGRSVFVLAVDIGIVLLVGYVAWVLVLRWIDARIEATKGDKDATRAQRLRTLLPLFRTFVQVVLLSMIAMTVLSSLGVDIGPLLAGAGIVGIAVGFGAQSTVANVLTGVAFLLVDAFRIGDYVEIGSIRGNVEGMSLTTLRLRHQRGAVHTLPFSEIRSITNYSRDWMMMRLEFRVPPTTDLALVKRLVKKVGQELSEDPEIAPNIIEPLKSQGVRAIEDNALVLGVKYIARPLGAFVIRREAYQRLLKAFQDNGIEMVGRGVVVRVEGGEGVPPSVAGAAAKAAFEEQAP